MVDEKKHANCGIVRCGKITLRDRLFNRLFGKQRRLTVIIPGDSVECVSIQELEEGESDSDE